MTGLLLGPCSLGRKLVTSLLAWDLGILWQSDLVCCSCNTFGQGGSSFRGSVLIGLCSLCLAAVLVQAGQCSLCFVIDCFMAIDLVVHALVTGPLGLECCSGCEERLMSCTGWDAVCMVVAGSSGRRVLG